jgi:hypothetical protein
MTVDYGAEGTSRALDDWAYRAGLWSTLFGSETLHSMGQSTRPVGSCATRVLNANQFLSIEDARSKIKE